MFSGPYDLQSVFLLLNGTLKTHLGQKMELTRRYFRVIIFHNFQCGLSIQECIDTINSFHSKEAPSYSTVNNRYEKFQRFIPG